MTDSINIVIADDHDLFIEGLSLLIKDQTEFILLEQITGKRYLKFYEFS